MTGRIIAACDGACKGNPGPAAWAWVIAVDAGGRPGRWEAGALGKATNNVAELTALERLLAAVDRDAALEVRMDSQYAMKAVTEWLPGWKRRGWKTSSGTPVANRDLIVSIDGLLAFRDVKFVYVPAHRDDGDRLNAFADQAASDAAISQVSTGGALTEAQSAAMIAGPVPGSGSGSGAGTSGSSTGAKSASRGKAQAQAQGRKTAATITAKFPGNCGGCGKRYDAGTLIAKGPKGWGHPECAAAAELS